VYTSLVLALTAVVVIPLVALPSTRRFAVWCALAFAGLFGWAMPWLATLRQ
jgi:hypothetical protein